MLQKRLMVIALVLSSLGPSLGGCDQSGSGSHMMGAGMMGGDMMGQMPPNNNDGPVLPELQSQEAKVFQRFCGQCHAPPDPGLHTAQDWPEVVVRMHQLMATQGKPLPNQAQLGEIMDYLQQHAK